MFSNNYYMFPPTLKARGRMSTETYNELFRKAFYLELQTADEDICIDAWTEKYWTLPRVERLGLQSLDPFFRSMYFYVM